MKEQKNGRIINVSSHSGRYFGWLTGAHYAASRASVLDLTRQLAKEVGKCGICVNAIAPGITIGGPRLDRLFQTLPQETQKAILSLIPLGRLGLPEDHASVSAFLGSEDSKYITGTTLDVNGGELMS
jgi:NAD(P)-dependent dehydrogenase (short-subunit alcohol dehydrogenase family)